MTRIPLANNRISFLKKSVQNFKPGICTERTVIWTEYLKNRKNKRKSACIQIAEAFGHVLLNKTIRIFPRELIVGNFISKQVGGQITPELIDVKLMQDIFKFPRRKTNPLQISPAETWQLLRILPFWMPRFVAIQADKSPVTKIQKLVSQLKAHFCIFRMIPATDSDRSRPPIPIDSGH